jgi:hypothetical protein
LIFELKDIQTLRIGTNAQEVMDFLSAPSLENLPDLALLNILKYLDIGGKKILRISNRW